MVKRRTESTIKKHAAFIWSVADLLRGDYKQSEDGKVILSLTALCLLVCTLLLVSSLIGIQSNLPSAHASATDCKSSAYDCTPGYTGANTSNSWAWTHYGGSIANTPTGYHNCTLYAAWRLYLNGVSDPGNWGNAIDWKSHVAASDHNPAVGSIAWWGSSVGPFGHVAYVEQVNGGNVFVRADNFVSSGGYTDAGWIAASSVNYFLHVHDVTGSNPSSPGPIVALIHGSRVDLSWGAAANATDYQISRSGVVLATITATTYLDSQVSRKQDYTYSVMAHNAYGFSSPVSLYVQTTVDSADRAYLPTKNGPAICGRAGDQTSQYLVCNVYKATGWISKYSAPNDWGYASDRSWLTNADGTVSYCRRVGTGDQALCDRFDGTNWTSSMSPHFDFGYPDTFP